MLLFFLLFPLNIFALFDLFDDIYEEYSTAFDYRSSYIASCPSSCKHNSKVLYSDLNVWSSQLHCQHPRFCGSGCYVKSYNTPMFHSSSSIDSLDMGDICWSSIQPSSYVSLSPKPLYIAIHHHNAAVFYPGIQTVSLYDPQQFEYSRGITYGKSTFFIFYDVSGSNKHFDDKKSGILDFINSLGNKQPFRFVVFNGEARILQTLTDTSHTSMNKIADDVCYITPYGGTKPETPFDLIQSYIFENDMSGGDAHIIVISDLKVYQSKKNLKNSILNLRLRVLQSFNSFQLHMIDSSDDNTGRRSWMQEFACDNDGHYIHYTGNIDELHSIMKLFIKVLQHRTNALPVGTHFPFLRMKYSEYGVFNTDGLAISKAHYVNVSDIDPLFPLRHAWTFSAAYQPRVLTSDDIGDGDEDYYPMPSIDKVRKFVLDEIIGYQCGVLEDFSEEEVVMIKKKYLTDDDISNQTLFCYETSQCPTSYDSIDEKYNFELITKCYVNGVWLGLGILLILLL
ncbi:VWFA domain-containing protein [Entamoeba marina]